jgi:hypothetical protein
LASPTACGQYVEIPSDHEVFPGHLSNYEPDAFSAVKDKEVAYTQRVHIVQTLADKSDKMI